MNPTIKTALALLVLLGGLCSTVLFPKDENSNERAYGDYSGSAIRYRGYEPQGQVMTHITDYDIQSRTPRLLGTIESYDRPATLVPLPMMVDSTDAFATGSADR